MMKTIAIAPMRNEGIRTAEVVRKFPLSIVDEILIVNDASTDDSPSQLAGTPATVLTLKHQMGCGRAIREGFLYGLEKGYDIFIVLAGNGKDNPALIPQLVAPIHAGKADFVQGSRYLPGGSAGGNMPLHRKFGTRAYSFLFSICTFQWITDATNGFRAIRRSILEDKRIDLSQEWLDGYAIESYLFVQAIRLGYRVAEVPVTKIYPSSRNGYTKMKPWGGWWNHFKPIPLVTLGIKK